jgi:DNA-binding MarR family transcriptional regulator
MDKLCAKHLIDRISCPEDRRVVHITITDKGKQLLNDISDNFNDEILKNINESEAIQLSELLDKLR